MKTEDALKEILSSISRKKANFFLCEHEGQVGLAAGSYQAIQHPTGIIVMMSVSREKLLALREACDELLKRQS